MIGLLLHLAACAVDGARETVAEAQAFGALAGLRLDWRRGGAAVRVACELISRVPCGEAKS